MHHRLPPGLHDSARQRALALREQAIDTLLRGIAHRLRKAWHQRQPPVQTLPQEATCRS